jgi:hypothetical protein
MGTTGRTRSDSLMPMPSEIRVAHAGGLVLVLHVPFGGRRGSQQGLVVVQLGGAGVGRLVACAVVHHHDVAHGREGRQERPQQLDQRAVDEDDLVLGVVDDVGELLGEQADVERVQHPAAAGRGEVELEVAGGVPGERRDAAIR